jgi:hypothetical protein
MNRLQRLIAILQIWNWRHNKPKKTEDFLFVVNSGYPVDIQYGRILYKGTGFQGFDFTVNYNHVRTNESLIGETTFNFSTLNHN